MRCFLSLFLGAGCITFDAIERIREETLLEARCVEDKDCDAEQVCLDGQCAVLVEPELFLVTGIEGTSVQRDPNGFARVVDTLAITGEGLDRVSEVRLDAAVLSFQVVTDKRVEAVLPANLSPGQRTLEVVHPSLGASLHALTFVRGAQGPKGPRGDEGLPGPSAQILPCASGGYRFTDLVDTQLSCGDANVLLTMDGAPLATAAASFAATAAEDVAGMQLENTAAGGAALAVIGRSNLLAAKLPVYVRKVSVAANATLIAMCDETLGQDLLLSGSCNVTATSPPVMFADCPVQDTSGSTCVTATGQRAYGLRCRTGAATDMVASITCLRVRP